MERPYGRRVQHSPGASSFRLGSYEGRKGEIALEEHKDLRPRSLRSLVVTLLRIAMTRGRAMGRPNNDAPIRYEIEPRLV
jgi:hypothetical protein